MAKRGTRGVGLAACLVFGVLIAASTTFIAPAAPPGVSPLLAPAVKRGAPEACEGFAQSLPSSFSCGLIGLCMLSLAASRKELTFKVVRKASILGGLDALRDEQDDEDEMKAQGRVEDSTGTSDEFDAFMEKEIDEADLEEYAKKIAEEEEQGSAARQVKYELAPARPYVFLLAKKNAVKTWSQGNNIGGYECQIAIATEKIRNMMLNMRDNPGDFHCRMKLVSMVCKRRKLLDRLSEKNLDSYMKIREELKIRHVYRLECLKTRMAKFKYAIKDRKPAPGRKTLNRLKKAKQLWNRRLANQLRQGRDRGTIHKTRKKLVGRQWFTRGYDEVAGWESNTPIGTYVDPLNLP